MTEDNKFLKHVRIFNEYRTGLAILENASEEYYHEQHNILLRKLRTI